MSELPLALTLDLDDTLWPNREVILRAEAVFHGWLRAHAPQTAARYPVNAMRELRQCIGMRHPELAHDLTALRILTTREALQASGDDPALAETAFEVFSAERHRVTLFGDVEESLERLAARFRLLALSNGNADLGRIGIDRWFVDSVSARVAGIAKPDARIFHAGCARLGLAPRQVMHVGDDWALDVVGARRAGLHSAWVVRPGQPAGGLPSAVIADEPGPGSGLHLMVASLQELVQALGA